MLYYMSLGFEPRDHEPFKGNQGLISVNEKLHEKLMSYVYSLPKIEGETYVSQI